MNIVIASDHAGFAYKTKLIPVLREAGYQPVDLGAFDESPSDYPDYAQKIALAIQQGQATRGIIICGSGVGVSIAANKFRGIKAGVCHDHYSAHQSVEHDDANVLCVGERIIGEQLLFEICLAFLEARFSQEARHIRRVSKINNIENANFLPQSSSQ